MSAVEVKRRSLVGMFAFIGLLHLLGWGTLTGIVAPAHYQLGDTGVLGVAVGLLAYTLGMRHAFDADHIAAIDNTTRKLMAENQSHRPLSVGFWFSLGHSTSSSRWSRCSRSAYAHWPTSSAEMPHCCSGSPAWWASRSPAPS